MKVEKIAENRASDIVSRTHVHMNKPTQKSYEYFMLKQFLPYSL